MEMAMSPDGEKPCFGGTAAAWKYRRKTNPYHRVKFVELDTDREEIREVHPCNFHLVIYTLEISLLKIQ